jgi:hypothetical protein
MAKARGISKYMDRITLEGNQINLGGKMIGVQNFDDLPADLHPRNICTEQRGDKTFFFKMDSPLSNHHPCTVTSWGQKYNCSEQAYFAKKAEICNDLEAHGRIMKATNPGTQKFFGGRITNTPTWEKQKLTVMKQVCSDKFTQNPALRDFLLTTGQTLLLEDNPSDGYWGIQMSRNNPRSDNVAHHKLNHMGLILMQVRKSIRDNQADTITTQL